MADWQQSLYFQVKYILNTQIYVFTGFKSSMKIRNYSTNQINFGAITLNKNEQERSNRLLAELDKAENKDQIKTGLLDVFDKHLQKEAELKSKGVYFQEDVLQKLYLNFFEAIENIKDLTTQKLIDIIDATRPDKNELKEQYRIATTSLNINLRSNINKSIENFITEDNLPVYKSSASPEERKEVQDKLQNFTKNANLTQKENELLKEKSKGKTIKELSQEKKRSEVVVRYLINNAIAKVQDANGILPEKFKEFSEKLIPRYSLNISSQEVKNFLLDNTNLMAYSPNELFENIDTIANLLHIDSKEFIQIALKQPQLFYQKPETILQNINKTSTLLKIHSEEFTKAALKHSQLFCQKPETILQNINKTSTLLKIDSEEFTKVALKHPSLFYQKPETILQNINKTSTLLKIDSEEFTKAALKQPSLFYQKPETILQNINKTSTLLKIEAKEFTKAALKQPSLFYHKPETILQNINKTSTLLKIEAEEFTKAALKQPSLFCLKPETILHNINKTSTLLKIEAKEFLQTALKKPSLFCQKPETIHKKVRISQYYKQIQNTKSDKIVIDLASDSNLYGDILNYLVKKSDGLKKALPKKEFVEYLENKNKVYNFEIPENDLAQEIIEFAEKFSKENLGKQIFSFKILKR